MTAKSLKWTLAALIVGSPAAMALGLGDIHLHSSLNAPLDADIDVVGATPEDLSSLKAQLASREIFTQNGLDWPAFLSTVTLKPVHTSDGRDVINVHSGVAITEPFVTMLVEINWARGHVTHEYTVLLDPPVYTPDQSQAAAPVAAPVVGATNRGGAIERSPAPPSAPAAEAPAVPQPAPPTASATAATSGQTYRVQRGDTLSRIASRESPNSAPPEVRRWMVAAYEGNPDSFDKNMNLLRAGTVLRLPDSAQLGAVSTSDALAEVRRQYAAWHPAAAAAANAQRAETSASEAGRLRLVTPGTAAGAAAGTAASTTARAGNAAGGTGSNALQGQVQQLQSQLDESQRLLAVRNADLAKLQAQLAAAENAAQTAAQNAAQASAKLAAASAPAAQETPAAPTTTAESSAATVAEASAPATAAPVPAAPVTHEPKVVTVPAEQASGSIFDTVLQYWWLLAGLVVVVLGFFGLRAWRDRQQSSFDDSLGHLNSHADTDTTGENPSLFDTQPLKALRDQSILVEESGRHAKPNFDERAGTAAPHTPTDTTISAETAINLDQGDPLAEADFHMAYGLYDQAADLVRIAIARDPTRRELKLKLLEVFFVWGNKEQFLQSARELASARGEAAPGEWEKIVIMGKQLAPEDPLFAGGGSYSGAGASGVDLNLEGGQGTNVDFDVLGSPSAVVRAAEGIDLDIGNAIGERDAAADRAAAQATDKNLALQRGGQAKTSVDSTTIEQPVPDGGPTIRQQVEKALQQTPRAENTAELAIDDLGLDLNSLDTVDQPILGAGADAPTMVAGLDDQSRRLLETAEQRGPTGLDPTETPTGSWKFTGSPTDATVSVEAAGHDVGATASLAELSSNLDFNLGLPGATHEADVAGRPDVDLDVGTATVPEASFGDTQRLGTEELALPDLEPVTMSEVGTKLDLARAYMDMGDPEGARNILEEVVNEGSVAQKQEAQRLIESLPG